MQPVSRPTAPAAAPPGVSWWVVGLLSAAFALAAVAAAIGVPVHGFGPLRPILGDFRWTGVGNAVTGLQAALAAVALLLGGAAVYRSRAHAGVVGLMALLSFGSVVAIPPTWDSMRLLSVVLGLVSVVGAGILALPPVGRRVAVSVLVLIHFGGILVAVTSPPQQPWITGQVWTRFYRPYLQFMYLNNAYHFYSPEPGPASVLWACREWSEPALDPAGNPIVDPATGVAVMKSYYTWMEFPRRPEDMRDPLGISYYRRLSSTEQINQMNPMPQGIAPEVSYARQQSSSTLRSDAIPYHPQVAVNSQYRPLVEASRRIQVPSYVRAIADLSRYEQQTLAAKREAARRAGRTEQAKRQYNEPGDHWQLVGIKLYRVQHNILTPDQFVMGGENGKGLTLYDPITYQPFFLGDFDPEGNLRDPRDGVLYWMIPLVRDDFVPDTGKQRRHWKFGGDQLRNLRDYTMRHATGKFFDEEERP